MFIDMVLGAAEFVMEHDLELVLEACIVLTLLYSGSLLWRITRSDCDLSVRGGTVDNKFWHGKVVWVVGASSGIGAGVAVRAAAAGATVLASARREDRLQQLANDFSSVNASSDLPGAIIPTPLDCTDRDACAEIVQKIVAEHGRIDIALLNAGAGAECLAKDMSMEHASKMFELNVLSCMNLTKLLIPVMQAAADNDPTRRSALVVTSSIAGKIASPIASCYAASKHAVQGYFNCVRLETQGFMDVTLACPGPIDTEFGEARMVGKDVPGAPKKYGKNYLSAERCAEIMMVATQRRRHEVWISPQPILWYVYIAEYFPTFFSWILLKKARKTIAAKVAAKKND